jgi:hypothetical protein
VLLGALLALPGAAAAQAVPPAGGYVAEQGPDAAATAGGGSSAPPSATSDSELPVITHHPQDVRIGYWYGVMTFTVAATGTDLSVRWERRGPEELWHLVPEESTDWTYTAIANASVALDGYLYRAVVSDARGNSVASDEARLRVVGPVEVTEQPQDAVTSEGGTATFRTAARVTGAEGDLEVQWQHSDDQGRTWVDSPGASARDWTFTTPTLRLAQHGRLYRALVQTDNGLTAEQAAGFASRPATVTVLAVVPEAVLHPVDQTVVEGGTVTFGATFHGTDAPTETVWHYSPDAGATWHPVPGAPQSPYLTVDVVTLAMDGRQYRAQFVNVAGEEWTDPATLTVAVAVPVVTQQPADQAANPGGSATFATAYGGTDAETLARWEVSTDGGATWAPQGAHGLSLSLDAVAPDMDGWMYRAQLENVAGSRWTDAATLHVVPRVAVRVTATVVRVDRLPGGAGTGDR